MADIAVVRRYARALFQSAHAAGTVEQVEEDLKKVDSILDRVPLLGRALGAPTLSVEGKQELLERSIGSGISPLSLRFLKLVVARRRQDVLPAVYPEFCKLADEVRGRLPVRVSAATALTDAERDRLADALTRRTGRRVELQVEIDPTLLGGMVVRMEDTVLDGSVRSRLNQLRARLLNG